MADYAEVTGRELCQWCNESRPQPLLSSINIQGMSREEIAAGTTEFMAEAGFVRISSRVDGHWLYEEYVTKPGKYPSIFAVSERHRRSMLDSSG